LEKQREEILEDIVSLEEALINNPTDDVAKKKLLELYLNAGDRWNEFNKLARELSEKYPNDISLLILLYKGYGAQGKSDLAQKFEEAIYNSKPITKSDYLSLIEFLKDIGKYDEAFNVIKEAESKNIALNELFFAKLDILIEKKDIKETLRLLSIEKLKELKDPDLYLIRAKLLIESAENIKDAGGELEFLCLEAIKLAPKKVDAYMLLLETYTDFFESHDKVIFLFKLAETNEIKSIQFYKNCLTSLLKMNEVDSTKELYEVINEYSTDSERVILDFIKVIHLELANIGLARILWNKYLDRKNFYDPRFYMSIISIGENVLDELDLKYIVDPQSQKELDFNSNIKKVEEVVRKAIIYSYDTLNLIEPENPEFYFLKGMFLQNIDNALAESALKEAIKLDSTFSYANYELGMLYMNSGRFLSAYDQFRAVFKSPFYDVNLFLDTYINMSEICIKFGWIEEAENYLDEAKSISPKDYRVHLSLGKIFFKEAKIVGSEVALEKAEKHLNEALELNPDECEAAYYLGSVFYEESLYLPAIRYYQIALSKGLVNERGERFATPANCYFWMSRAYYQMYKDLLFSSKEYLLEAIKFARSVPYDNSETPSLFLEYLLELYNTIGSKDEITKIERMISEREKEKKPITLKKRDKSGIIKILTVFSPSLSEQSEKAVFSKGNLSGIEVVAFPGSGNLKITGNIGESFRNSINVAFGFANNYIISKYGEELVKTKDIIVDIPGWFPKYDGPSAGSGIAICIVSAILNKPIPENITVTGEISILGNILPVGGIKEKIEATIDKGIERVYIPKDNKWDYLDMLLKGEDTSKLPEVVAVSNVSQIVEDLLS
jgi:hypothetical protein